MSNVVYTYLNTSDYDVIEVGDLIRVNDWKVSYKVNAVSKNFFCAIRSQFGDNWYTVIDKRKNCCGPSNLIFDRYCSKEEPNKLLEMFEKGYGNGGCDVSQRLGLEDIKLYVKRKEELE
jgi:hypothetical protein